MGDSELRTAERDYSQGTISIEDLNRIYLRHGKQADINAEEIAKLVMVAHGFCKNGWEGRAACDGGCGAETVWALPEKDTKDSDKEITIARRPIELDALESFTVDIGSWVHLPPYCYLNTWKAHMVVAHYSIQKLQGWTRYWIPGGVECMRAGKIHKAIGRLREISGRELAQ